MNRVVLVLVLVLVLGCPSGPDAAKSVTVYCAADREFAEGIFQTFEKETGVRVDAKWDTETAKTTGLSLAIQAEKDRPRCDVFWDNEVLQTLILDGQGLLAPLDSSVLARSPVHGERWVGFAARARVLLVNTDLVKGDLPKSVKDLGDPKWKGKTGIANPGFGTTQCHVAALFAKLGEAEARALLEAWKANGIAVCGSNGDVKTRVASGELAFGVLDTDDANEAVTDGKHVTIVFPDQDGMGTVLLPNALGVVKDAPHAAEAAKLVDWLASAKGEGPLASGPGKHFPLLGNGVAKPQLFPEGLKTLDVKWEDVARVAPVALDAAKKTLLAGP
jgi:iron(III) transport system substrate-binding protein